MEEIKLDFQEVYDTFQPKINRYLTRLVGESDEEDLTQEIIIKINKALIDFRGESDISTWIYRIATNAALDILRSPSQKKDVHNCSAILDVEDPTAEVADQNAWTEKKLP